MTVLVLQNKKDEIILAADSGVFTGSSGIKEENSTKIIQVKENIVFASTGKVSDKNLFELFLIKNEPETNTRHGVLRMFTEFLKWKKEFTDEIKQNNHFFLVYNETAYQIESGCSITEIPVGEFRTLGAGMQEARCAMYLEKTPKEAVDLAKKLNCWAAGDTVVHVIKKSIKK